MAKSEGQTETAGGAGCASSRLSSTPTRAKKYLAEKKTMLAKKISATRHKRHVMTDDRGLITLLPGIHVEDKYLFDRRSSKWMPIWDFVMIMALLYAATLTPYEVTFIMEGPCITPLWIVNRFVDCLFMADIFICFNLIEYDSARGIWLYSRRKIAWRYLKSWFVIDLVSILPFDTIGCVMDSPALAGRSRLPTYHTSRGCHCGNCIS